VNLLLGFCFSAFCKPERLLTKFQRLMQKYAASGSIVGCGTMLHAGRSRVRVPMRWIFLNLPNLPSCTMALVSTQPLTEISTRNLPGG
jgi:hypothetical protein